MMLSDEIAILRRRMDEHAATTTRWSEGAACCVVTTLAVSSYPTTAGVMYGVQQVSAECVEAENSSPTYTPISGTFYALHTGATAPDVGSNYVVTLVQGLWVFS
ncbi:hypothetical protein EP7_005644 (plasmid) [Isosphaeraceae bacterium EP7]